MASSLNEEAAEDIVAVGRKVQMSPKQNRLLSAVDLCSLITNYENIALLSVNSSLSYLHIIPALKLACTRSDYRLSYVFHLWGYSLQVSPVDLVLFRPWLFNHTQVIDCPRPPPNQQLNHIDRDRRQPTAFSQPHRPPPLLHATSTYDSVVNNVDDGLNDVYQ